MKDWNYYDTISAPFYGGDYCVTLKKKAIEKINNMLLTAADRETMINQVPIAINKEIAKLNEPYYAEKRRLDNEFWADARATLGYDKFLNKEGAAILEVAAYQRGHSSGFSEIYYELTELTELAERLVKCVKGDLTLAVDNIQ